MFKDSEKILEEQLGHSRRFIEDLQKLQKFLLSVTAKDVSVLLTFRAIKGQLISKCPFGVQIDQDQHKNFVRISALASKKRSNKKKGTWIFF